MAEKITPRAQDFSEWYQDVVMQSKLADHSPVKGCMVIRPNGYAIWEQIQKELDRRIKGTGVRNAYFPLFIPESFLKKEAEHVEGFAPQCAVVTYAGAKDLEEKLVVRPTSETIINSMFAKWIQSYRDLPMMLNQWCNVVRWEMRTRLFLRTSEFLWQEGHTCFATAEEAEENAQLMLKVYTEFSENVLAMPVLPGMKSESEKFAGALRTYCIEAMMQDKKALQAGTSHNLSSNFAKAFDTKFLNSSGSLEHVHQTSWGVSTRLIGGVVMTHSDDKGLVLPPVLAPTHLVFIPFFNKADLKGAILEKCAELKTTLIAEASKQGLGYDCHVLIDKDETKQPGWKFHEYELLGIPLRAELGPRDLAGNQVMLSRRDTGEKFAVSFDDLPTKIVSLLKQIQKDLLIRARAFRESNTFKVETYADFAVKIEQTGGFFESSWCQSKACEEKMKTDHKATIRCLPLDHNMKPIATGGACLVCASKETTGPGESKVGMHHGGKAVKVIIAKSY